MNRNRLNVTCRERVRDDLKVFIFSCWKMELPSTKLGKAARGLFLILVVRKGIVMSSLLDMLSFKSLLDIQVE